MAQVIYAVKYDDEDREAEFWKEDLENITPFVFFMRIQCEGNVEELWKQRRKFEEKLEGLSGTEKIKVNVYLTYNNSDILLVLKSATYQEGMDLIHILHCNRNLLSNTQGNWCKLKNSFSVLTVKQDFIDTIDLENRTKNTEEIIEEVDIRLIEKTAGGIDRIEKYLREKYQRDLNDKNFIRKQILGADDEVFSFYNISWKVFLSFFRSTEGILNNANSYYKDSLSGTTTAFPIQLNIIEKSKQEEMRIKENQEIPKSANYANYIKEMWEKLNKIRNTEQAEWYKELFVIMNALTKFKQPIFSDYIFVTIIQPLNCLLEFVLDFNDGDRKYFTREKNETKQEGFL